LWNWKAQLNWKPSRDLLVYAGVTQGAKAGSFNSGDPSLFANNGAGIPYKPERLISYEVGFKSSILDSRLRFNASAYYYDYHNYQAAQWTGLANVIINADARMYGAEAELAGALAPNLDISFNVGWQHNKVMHVPIGAGFADRETAFAPEWTFSGLARYTYPSDVFGGKLAIQGSGSYQSAVWHNLNNFDANRLPGYFLADARISWTSADDRYTLAVFGKNVFDKRYETVGFDESYVTGANLSSPGRPHWFGVNMSAIF
jgi:iron complex outermembrane receptor protein